MSNIPLGPEINELILSRNSSGLNRRSIDVSAGLAYRWDSSYALIHQRSLDRSLDALDGAFTQYVLLGVL